MSFRIVWYSSWTSDSRLTFPPCYINRNVVHAALAAIKRNGLLLYATFSLAAEVLHTHSSRALDMLHSVLLVVYMCVISVAIIILMSLSMSYTLPIEMIFLLQLKSPLILSGLIQTLVSHSSHH